MEVPDQLLNCGSKGCFEVTHSSELSIHKPERKLPADGITRWNKTDVVPDYPRPHRISSKH
ncbi:UNVERIFIED_CONTAM: hypothetical protein NCL1_18673 [Trichonephila clavipes]